MLLTTLRKPARFVLQALFLLLGAVYVQAMAAIVMVGIMLFVGLVWGALTGGFGIVGVITFVAVVTVGIWAYPHAARVIATRKERRERDEAEKREREGQASWEWTIRHLAADIEADIDYALANDMVAIDAVRQMRNNDNRFSQISKEERDRIDDLLLKVRQREDAKEAAERKSRAEADRQRAAQVAANQEQAAWAEAERQKKAKEKRQATAAKRAAKQQAEEVPQADIWKETGGPPKPGPNWIRETWPHEARDFTPWIAKHLKLVSACTGWDLRLEGTEVYAAGGRVDIVARENKSKSKVVIENQLDSADFEHWRQLVFYGDTLNAKIRIWIAADFRPNIRRDVRNQNRQNESRSDGAIYYLLRLRPDQTSPISLVEGPRNSQAHQELVMV